MMYCYTHPEKNVSIKVLYFALEETPQRILNRFYSWLLFKKHNIRISPSDLRSSNNEKPVSEEILEILKSDEFKEIVAYFEKCFEFPLGETNATGIYKYCKSYAENHGTVHKKAGKYKDELGVERETMVFSHYEPSNPNEYVFPVVDTINLIDTERGMTKKQTIDKLSEYCAKYLRNRYFQSPIVIQQQNADNESIENIKLNRNRPDVRGLGDSRYTSHDCNIMLGLFSPFKFGLKEYLGYSIDKLKDHFRTLEVLISRDGELGGIVGLFFDGATCTWTELPKSDNTSEMSKVYNYLNKINSKT